MKKVNSTPFSDFIRNATPDEKEMVYREVLDKAIASQNQIATPFQNQLDNKVSRSPA